MNFIGRLLMKSKSNGRGQNDNFVAFNDVTVDAGVEITSASASKITDVLNKKENTDAEVTSSSIEENATVKAGDTSVVSTDEGKQEDSCVDAVGNPSSESSPGMDNLDEAQDVDDAATGDASDDMDSQKFSLTERFRQEIIGDGDVFFLQDPVRKKLLTPWKHGELGWNPYFNFDTDCMAFFEANGINRGNAREWFKKSLITANTKTMDETNINAQFLIRTPNGDVFDLKGIERACKEGIDPEQSLALGRKNVRDFKDRRITLSTGVDYDTNFKNNVKFVFAFLERAIKDYNTISDDFLDFLGRLIIGGNISKEIVPFLGMSDTGKSTLVDFLKLVLGSYAGVMTDIVMHGNNAREIQNEVLTYQHKRVLMHHEGDDHKPVNTVILKRLTGDRDPQFAAVVIQDSNSPMLPDNFGPGLEAFDERLTYIPFVKSESEYPPMDDVIAKAKENLPALFTLMLHNSVHSLRGKKKITSETSQYVKSIIDVIQNPVREFFLHGCQAVADDRMVTRLTLYRFFQAFCRKYFEGYLFKGCTFFNEETLKLPILSEHEFGLELARYHKFYNPHGEHGACFTNIEMLEEKLPWKDTLDIKRQDPALQAKETIHAVVKDARDKIKTVNLAEKSGEITDEASREVAAEVQLLAKTNPKDVMETMVRKDTQPYDLMDVFMEFNFFAPLRMQIFMQQQAMQTGNFGQMGYPLPQNQMQNSMGFPGMLNPVFGYLPGSLPTPPVQQIPQNTVIPTNTIKEDDDIRDYPNEYFTDFGPIGQSPYGEVDETPKKSKSI
jgi:energy-coupling factor transporter ATP-binding protein EcfA2